jgi:hypothetical protein
MAFLDRRNGFETSNKWRAPPFGEGPTLTSRHLSLVACFIQALDTERKTNVKPKGTLLFQIPPYFGQEILQGKLFGN